jgi:hypothetical protein
MSVQARRWDASFSICQNSLAPKAFQFGELGKITGQCREWDRSRGVGSAAGGVPDAICFADAHGCSLPVVRL